MSKQVVDVELRGRENVREMFRNAAGGSTDFGKTVGHEIHKLEPLLRHGLGPALGDLGNSFGALGRTISYAFTGALGPLGLLVAGLSTAAAAVWGFYKSGEEAAKKALEQEKKNMEERLALQKKFIDETVDYWEKKGHREELKSTLGTQESALSQRFAAAAELDKEKIDTWKKQLDEAQKELKAAKDLKSQEPNPWLDLPGETTTPARKAEAERIKAIQDNAQAQVERIQSNIQRAAEHAALMKKQAADEKKREEEEAAAAKKREEDEGQRAKTAKESDAAEQKARQDAARVASENERRAVEERKRQADDLDRQAEREGQALTKQVQTPEERAAERRDMLDWMRGMDRISEQTYRRQMDLVDKELAGKPAAEHAERQVAQHRGLEAVTGRFLQFTGQRYDWDRKTADSTAATAKNTEQAAKDLQVLVEQMRAAAAAGVVLVPSKLN